MSESLADAIRQLRSGGGDADDREASGLGEESVKHSDPDALDSPPPSSAVVSGPIDELKVLTPWAAERITELQHKVHRLENDVQQWRDRVEIWRNDYAKLCDAHAELQDQESRQDDDILRLMQERNNARDEANAWRTAYYDEVNTCSPPPLTRWEHGNSYGWH